MTFAIYRSPVVFVTGGNGQPAAVNKLSEYAPSESDPDAVYEDIGNLCRPVFYGVLSALPATHAAVRADVEITALSPELADQVAFDEWLNGRALPLGSTAATLIGDGFPISWVRNDHTRRQLFEHIFRVWKLRAYAVGDNSGFPHSKVLFGQDLSATFGQLTNAERTGVRDWIERGVGVDTTNNIQGTTKAEQVLNFLTTNWIGLKPDSLGGITF